MQRRILLYTIVCVGLMFIFSANTFAQAHVYIDGRPAASMRIPVKDEGIIVRYGNGPDSCDVYGSREAVVNRVGDTYYLFYDSAGRLAGFPALQKAKI